MKTKLSILFFLIFLHFSFSEELFRMPFIVNADNRILIQGNINGNEGYYALDTGATISAMIGDIENLKIITSNFQLMFLNTSLTVNVREVNSINLGGGTLNGKAQIAQLPPSYSELLGPEVLGIIGMQIMAGFIFEINMEEKSIIVYDSIPSDYIAPISIGSSNKNLSQVLLPVNGIAQPFLIDTGRPGKIVIPSGVKDILSTDDYITISNAENQLMFHNSSSYDVFKISSLKIGNIELRDSIYSGNDSGKGIGLIGVDFLKHVNSLFDYTHNHFYLHSIESEGFWEDSFGTSSYSGYGLNGLIHNPQSVEVYNVVAHSPAWRQFIRSGDIILKINNTPVSEMSRMETASLLDNVIAGTEIKLEIENRGEIILFSELLLD